MKKQFAELIGQTFEQGQGMAAYLQAVISAHLPELEEAFEQDMSHISQAASYAGNMTVDDVVFVKDNLYRCDYSYDWEIAWTCSGTQEAGRVKEKVRFTLDDSGEITFKFLVLGA